MDAGIGVIFQRTKPCSQFYCSDENTYTSYRQYYQQKALEVHNNNSLLHCCCKPCVRCDNWPGLMGQLFFCWTPQVWHKTIFCKWKYNLQSTLTWLTCNKQFWCLIFTTNVPLLCTTFWHRLIVDNIYWTTCYTWETLLFSHSMVFLVGPHVVCQFGMVDWLSVHYLHCVLD